MNKKKWDKSIKQAQKYISNYDQARWTIVDLANECCIENSRQRASTGQYTYRKFSMAIGLDYKTLIDWVRLKRNVFDKLTVKMQEAQRKIPLELIKRVSLRVDDDSYTREVRMIFREEAGVNPDRLRFIKYIKHMKTVLYNVQRPTRLVEIQDCDLDELMKISGLIFRLSGKELKFRTKFGKPSGIERAENIDNVINAVERMV